LDAVAKLKGGSSGYILDGVSSAWMWWWKVAWVVFGERGMGNGRLALGLIWIRATLKVDAIVRGDE
jgi:hypothetical protein